MRFLFIALLALTLSPADLTLTVSREDDGYLTILVTVPTSRHIYVAVDATPGVSTSGAVQWETDLEAHTYFAARFLVIGGPTPGAVHVRVWDGGEGPSAEQVIAIPAGPTQHIYIPLLVHGA